jgi:hypothetical protein
MDLSRLRCRGDQSMAVALTCLGSWSSLVTDLQDDGEIRIVVRDEVWRQMRLGLRAVQAVDSDLRLSRADKKIQILRGSRSRPAPLTWEIGGLAVGHDRAPCRCVCST